MEVISTGPVFGMNPPPDALVPNIEFFMIDAVVLIEILSERTKDLRHALFEFDEKRQESWSLRWKSCVSSRTQKNVEYEYVWKEYICGLCDAIFGIWKARRASLFHGGPAPESLSNPNVDLITRGCIRKMLSPELARTAPLELIVRDYHLFDAAYIERLALLNLRIPTNLRSI